MVAFHPMKAVRVSKFGGPEVLDMHVLPSPDPGPDEVLIKIYAAGINPVDTYIRQGINPAHPLPYVPGFDAAGRIVALGPGVEEFKPGDSVYLSTRTSCCYAEFVVCSSDQVYSLPDKLSFVTGAAIGIPYATAFRALFQRGAVQQKERVLVHGASGSVGQAIIQLAQSLNLFLVGTAGTKSGLDVVNDSGATVALNHSEPGYLDKALALTDGLGFDLIIEMLANVNLGVVAPLLARRARVVVVGSRGRVEINPRDLMVREADIRGVHLFQAPTSDVREAHQAIRNGLSLGSLSPRISDQIPFEIDLIREAHFKVLKNGNCGKSVIVFP